MKASCQCGKLSAEVEDDAPPLTVLCHCVDCQRRSGSPFGAFAYFPEGSVTISGVATEFARGTDEGNRFTSGFCPRCGSTVYGRTTKHPALLGITIGSFADPHFPQPVLSVYEQSRHAWIALPNDMRHYPKGATTDDGQSISDVPG